MEENINIAEILKNKPKGTKLYADAFGELSIEDIYAEGKDELGITLSSKDGDELIFYNDGRYNTQGESILVPSKEMRDWSKFAWKEGDVLVNKDGDAHVIFEGFDDDTYETFNGNNYLWKNEGITMCFGEYEDELPTSDFSKANKEDAQKYIHQIEKRLGYKLNLETLEIEKHPEFKDWDFITIKLPKGSSLICVFKAENDENYYLHASLDSRGMITINENSYCSKSGCIVRLSTEEEKTAFFDALARKCKIWDVEKKKIIGLKKKWTPKPFDRVITRNADDDIWTANIFSHMDSHGEYVTIGCVGGYTYCIPYNEVTAKLIGTTNNVEG